MRRNALLVVVLGLGAALLKRRRDAARAEQELWHEATTAPDLR